MSRGRLKFLLEEGGVVRFRRDFHKRFSSLSATPAVPLPAVELTPAAAILTREQNVLLPSVRVEDVRQFKSLARER